MPIMTTPRAQSFIDRIPSVITIPLTTAACVSFLLEGAHTLVDVVGNPHIRNMRESSLQCLAEITTGLSLAYYGLKNVQYIMAHKSKSSIAKLALGAVIVAATTASFEQQGYLQSALNSWNHMNELSHRGFTLRQ